MIEAVRDRHAAERFVEFRCLKPGVGVDIVQAVKHRFLGRREFGLVRGNFDYVMVDHDIPGPLEGVHNFLK